MPQLNHAQIAHRWAKRDRADGLRNRSLIATNSTIYSYGLHYPIATWHDERTVLFNADPSSVTTQRHKRFVRLALITYRKDVAVLSLPHAAWNDHGLALLHFETKIRDSLKSWKRAYRYKDCHMRLAGDYLQQCRQYCEFHKLNLKAILRRNGPFAVDVAMIALNPVPATEY